MGKKIYISPSDQVRNRYAVGGTTEAIQCRKIALELVKALERCGFEAKTNTTDDSDDSMEHRIAESNAWGADLHLPIHTNACNGNVMGTRLFCHAFGGEGHAVCKAILATLAPITPGDSDNITARPELAEIRNVTAPTAYVEVGFHDNPTEAAWIIENTTPIAEAICQGLCSYYGAAYIPADAPAPAIYNRLEDVPGYAQATIAKLIERGYLEGKTTGLALTEDMVRILTIMDRSGAWE